MPNIKSAKKRVRVNDTKLQRNKALRSSLRTTLKKADFALTNDTEDKAVLVAEAIKKIDISASKGILHKNNAANKKSALTLRLNAAK